MNGSIAKNKANLVSNLYSFFNDRRSLNLKSCSDENQAKAVRSQ